MGYNKSGLKSLDRTIDIIELFAKRPYSLSVQEISDTLKVNRTTIYKALNTLCERKYLEKIPNTSRYKLGFRMYEIGQKYKYSYPFTLPSQECSSAIYNEFNLHLSLGTYQGNNMVQLLLTRMPTSVYTSNLYPYIYCICAHSSALGKVLLAGIEDSELEESVRAFDYHAFTPNTIITPDALLSTIAEVRKNGCAYDEEEYLLNTCCVAAPIVDYSGKTVAGISITRIPLVFYKENRDVLSNRVKTSAIQISRSIGWDSV